MKSVQNELFELLSFSTMKANTKKRLQKVQEKLKNLKWAFQKLKSRI